MHLHRVGASTTPRRLTWSPEDCALYALALGAGVEHERFTVDSHNGSGQLVYPTFVLAGVLAADSATWPDPALQTGDYHIGQLVLGEQALRFHRSIPAVGDVRVVTTVGAIYDKGSGALVVLESRVTDNRTQLPLFDATTGVFVIGGGGFGGERGGAGVQTKVPNRPASARVWLPTSANQTLWYRYAGNDRNPIHVDPEVAREAGYRAPILMGQNTLGFACRGLVETVCGGDPKGLASLSGRFA
ncbi:MAG TPA: MaoC/PaaZ C-terminal domain-containing protein, partial [Acidimicrobiales bacterium]|nr:MaoC/PaaZ C-terminal domain-containing protein [Acidimicrobiales bacterium]